MKDDELLWHVSALTHTFTMYTDQCEALMDRQSDVLSGWVGLYAFLAHAASIFTRVARQTPADTLDEHYVYDRLDAFVNSICRYEEAQHTMPDDAVLWRMARAAQTSEVLDAE